MNRERIIQITLTLLRFVSGLLLLQVGGTKIVGWLGGTPPTGGTVPLMSQMWIGGVLEMVGGALLMIGLLTRPAAFILSGQMAVAYFQFHQPHGAWPVQNGGQPAVLFCFILLFLAAMGGGEYSLDSKVFRKKG